MDNLIVLGETIKKRRKSLNITQNDLAEISGVSVRSLKNIESGKGNPTIVQLLKILNSLGLTFNLNANE
ncbi:MAG: helix-turn-helix domain-containing protein [Ignavibacteria bacterium]|nr:helix-turn-helix domain-containing protein [Ignavibacteria bacterium]